MFCKAPAAMWGLLDATYGTIIDITFVAAIVDYIGYGQNTTVSCTYHIEYSAIDQAVNSQWNNISYGKIKQ